MYSIIIEQWTKGIYYVTITHMFTDSSCDDVRNYYWKVPGVNLIEVTRQNFRIGNMSKGDARIFAKARCSGTVHEYELPENGHSQYTQEDNILDWVDSLH
jgi:hypothetical protein